MELFWQPPGAKDGLQNQFLPKCSTWKELYPLREGEPEEKKPFLGPAASADDAFLTPQAPGKSKWKFSFEDFCNFSHYLCN